MANWTQQDVEYLRRNPHLWKRFKDRFGSLPNDFQRPVPGDTDLQYLKNNPQQAEKFREAFGELPEEFGPQVTPSDINTQAFGIGQAPQDQGMQPRQDQGARRDMDAEAPPEEMSPEFERGVERAPLEFNRMQAGGQQIPGFRPNIVDVPEEYRSPLLQEREHGEEGSALNLLTSPGAWNKKVADIISQGFSGEEKEKETDAMSGATDALAEEEERPEMANLRRQEMALTDEEEEVDSWAQVYWKTVKLIPKQFYQNWVGYEARYAADKSRYVVDFVDQLDYLARQEGTDLLNSSAVQAIAAENGITEEDVIEDVLNNLEGSLASEEKKLQLAHKLGKEIEDASPKTREGSLKYWLGAMNQAAWFMAPSIAVGMATKNTSAALGVMGTSIWGTEYADARESGRTHEQAMGDAMFYSAAELVAERIPLGIIMGKGGGSFLKKILKAGATEGMEEMFNEALAMGYDMGVLNDSLTWGEALKRLKHAGIIGAGVGIKLAGATEAVHKLVKDEADPNKVPPHLREMVAAHQQLREVVQRTLDPSQRASKEELDVAKERYDRVKRASQEAENNPEYAAAVDEASKEVMAAERELSKAKKPDAKKSAQAKVDAATKKLDTLIREGKIPEDEEIIAQDPEEPVSDKEPAKPAKEPAKAQRSASDEGKIDAAISQLSTVGANAPVPEKVKDQMIAEGLAKETPAGGLMVLPAGRRRVQEWRERRHENVINVGLDIGGEKDALSPERVRSAIEELGAGVAAEERQRSETENTMVVTLNRELTDKIGRAHV